MGYCYSINLKMIFDSSDRETVHNGILKEALKVRDLTPFAGTLDTALHLMFSVDPWNSEVNIQTTYPGDGTCVYEVQAQFDASYLWDDTMGEWFKECSVYLNDGSFLEIYPDDAVEIYIREDGVMKFGYLEYVDINRITFADNGILYQYDVADATTDNADSLKDDLEHQIRILENSDESDWVELGPTDKANGLHGCLPIHDWEDRKDEIEWREVA